MSNPVQAFENTACDECGEEVPEGGDLFLHDGTKFCSDCANEEEIVCECGSYKKPEFKVCYECNLS